MLWHDLALGHALFHWESQSTTAAASATGQRTIHHYTRGSRVLLFRYAEACGYVRAREQRKQDGRPGAPTEPFVCLGFARYESHEGERLHGDPLAAGAPDPGGVAARLLCSTPTVAWHSSGVGGLRGHAGAARVLT